MGNYMVDNVLGIWREGKRCFGPNFMREGTIYVLDLTFSNYQDPL